MRLKKVCDVIAMHKNFVEKLNFSNKNLNEYLRQTSKKFFEDGKKIKFI